MGLNFGSLAGNAVSGIPIIGDVLGGILGGIGGGRSGSELKAAENAKAYSAAMAGNRAGLEFLKGKGGLGPTVLSNDVKLNSTNPWKAGTTITAWTDPGALADARNKYQQVVAAAAAGSGGAAAALGPVTPLTPAGQAADKVAEVATSTIAGVPAWALALGIGAVGYLALRGRR